MYDNWKEIEDNENIKKEFADYFHGLMRHEETRLVLPPKGAANVPLYQVLIFCANVVIKKTYIYIFFSRICKLEKVIFGW